MAARGKCALYPGTDRRASGHDGGAHRNRQRTGNLGWLQGRHCRRTDLLLADGHTGQHIEYLYKPVINISALNGTSGKAHRQCLGVRQSYLGEKRSAGGRTKINRFVGSRSDAVVLKQGLLSPIGSAPSCFANRELLAGRAGQCLRGGQGTGVRTILQFTFKT